MKKVKKGILFGLISAIILSVNSISISTVSAETLFNAKYDFGAGAVASGYTRVDGSDVYSAIKGYGFLRADGVATNINIDGMRGSVATATNGGDASTDALNGDFIEAVEPSDINKIYGDTPMSFAVRVPTSNQTYDVKVVIGRNDKDMRLNLITEKKHYLFYDQIVPKGTYITKEYTVSVQDQAYKGDGDFKDNTISVCVWGDNVCINSVEITENPNRNTIWMLGDSTMGDCIGGSPSNHRGMASYGAGLSKYVSLGYGIANYSQGGLDSTSVKQYFYQFMGRIKPGDYVIEGIGHNDDASLLETYYKPNLRYVADVTASKGATFILASPIERRSSYSTTSGQYVNTLTVFRDATKAIAEEKQVPYIDLNTLTLAEYNKVGQFGAKYYFWNGWNYNGGNQTFTSDATHPSAKGTDMITGNFSQEVKRLVNENNAKPEAERDAVISKLNPLFATLNNEQILYPTLEYMMDGSTAIKDPITNSNYPKALAPAVTFAFPLTIASAFVDIDDDENKILKTVSVQKDVALDEYGHLVVAFYNSEGRLVKFVKKNTDPTIGAGALEVVDFNEYYPANAEYFKVFALDGIVPEPANPDRPLTLAPLSKALIYDKIERYLVEKEDFLKYQLLPGDDLVTGTANAWSSAAGSASSPVHAFGQDPNGRGFAHLSIGTDGNSYYFGITKPTQKITSGKVYFNANIRMTGGIAGMQLAQAGSFNSYPACLGLTLNASTGVVNFAGITVNAGIKAGTWYNVTCIFNMDTKAIELIVKDGINTFTTTGTTASGAVDISSLIMVKSGSYFNYDITDITLARLRDPIPPKQYNAQFTVKNNTTGEVIPNAVITINGNNFTTDTSGMANVTLINGTYPYSVTALGYNTKSDGSLTISKKGTAETVNLEPSAAPQYKTEFAAVDLANNALTITTIVVKDTVYGNTILPNATDGYYYLIPGEYSYTITKTDYLTKTGTFNVADSAQKITVTMPISYAESNFDSLALANAWGFTGYTPAVVASSATEGGDATRGNILKFSISNQGGPRNTTKILSPIVSGQTKAKVEYDWYVAPISGGGSNSADMAFVDSTGIVLFALNQKGTVLNYYMGGAAATATNAANANINAVTAFGNTFTTLSKWMHVDLAFDFTANTVTVNITDLSNASNKITQTISLANSVHNSTIKSVKLAAVRNAGSNVYATMYFDNFMIYQEK